MLRDLQELCTKLNTTTSANAKKAILSEYPQCKPLIFYALNPFYQFNVTSKNLKKRQDLILDESVKRSNNIIDLLDKLRKREITGYEAIKITNRFIADNEEYAELIYNIIDKDLKTRTKAKTVNKVFPELVPTFDVALANKYFENVEKVDFKDDWYLSRKLDGVRCLCMIKSNNEVEFYSRTGKPFYTLGKIAESIKNCEVNLSGSILDGEICLINEDGSDNFNGIMSEISNKDHTIENVRFMVFDIISKESFDNKKGSVTFSDRIFLLNSNKEKLEHDGIITILDQDKVTNQEFFDEKVKEAFDNGWEGVMIRKDTCYEGKRSSDMLKVKKFEEDEFVVTGTESGPFRVIKDGKQVTIETLTKVHIDYKGTLVRVGSGFSLAERELFHEDPTKIIGKTITVQYQEESKNKEGRPSIRIGTLKCIHGLTREL